MRILYVLLLAAFVSSASPAAAQDSTEYKSLVKQAVREFDAANWVEARVLFQRAHALNPNARTWRGLGLTAYELRKYVDAIAELEAALADSRKPLDPKARAEVTELLGRAREFVAVYRVTVKPAGAEVLVDGEPATLRDGQLFLDPGNHSVVVRAPGYTEERKDLRIDEPRNDALSIELRVAGQPPEEEPAKPEAEPPVVQAAPQSEAPRRRVWTWVLGGSAVAAAGVGVGLSVGASHKHDDFETCQSACGSLKSKGQSLQLGANIAYGTAGALLAGAIVAWFLEGRSSGEAPNTALFVHPQGVGVTGRF